MASFNATVRPMTEMFQKKNSHTKERHKQIYRPIAGDYGVTVQSVVTWIFCSTLQQTSGL